MKDNVRIRVWRKGNLGEERSAHNVWVDRGREYLARLVTLSSFGPDTPAETARLRYMGFGIGGALQSRLDLSSAAPMTTAYPAGEDPNATSGYTYRSSYSIDPPITTLERPVRVSGGESPYSAADPADVWMVQPPNFFTTHLSPYEATCHATLDGATEVAYGTLSEVPLSEAGLFTDETGVDVNTPFSPLVAYVNFGTIVVDPLTRLEFIWSVKF